MGKSSRGEGVSENHNTFGTVSGSAWRDLPAWFQRHTATPRNAIQAGSLR